MTTQTAHRRVPDAKTLRIPEAHYPCDGSKIEYGMWAICHSSGPKFFPADQLYAASLWDRVTEREHRGFFCERCITALEQSTSGKANLAGTILANVAERMIQYFDEDAGVSRLRLGPVHVHLTG